MNVRSRNALLTLIGVVAATVSLAPPAVAAPQMRVTNVAADRFQPLPGPRSFTQEPIGSPSPGANMINLSSVPETRAGAHPDMRMRIDMCSQVPDDNVSPAGCTADDLPRRLRDLKISLPPALLGNPANVPTCPYGSWLLGACPLSSAVGWTRTDPVLALPGGGMQARVETYIFNVQTFGLEPARLGTSVLDTASPQIAVPSIVSVRTAGDFGIDALTPNIPSQLSAAIVKIKAITIVLFGQAGPANKPFFVNPTKCGDSRIDIRTEAWLGPPGTGPIDFPQTQDSTTIGENHADITTTDCDSSNFTFANSNPPPGEDEQPSVKVQPDSFQAGAPTGYKVNLEFPNSEFWTRHQAHLKDADISLPDGVGLSAAAGNGLEGCTPAQWGVTGSPQDFPSGHLNVNDDPIKCPAGSEIGDVKIDTPVLKDPDTGLTKPLLGHAYFAKPSTDGRPTDAHPWKLLIGVKGSGLLVKLAGDVTVDEDGTVHTKFVDNPQTPFTNFELQLHGGAKSVLQNPRTCVPHTGHATLTGWNDGEAISTPSITPTGCADPEPFNIAVGAHADNEDAGASSPSHLTVERPDGNQLIKDLKLALPAGLVGSLNAVPLCSGADAEAGNCTDGSKIGTLKVTVGSDASQIEVPGSLYLAQPTDPADVATLGIVIPSKVGPIDLGDVVLTNHVRLRQSDGGLDALLGVSKLRARDGTLTNLDKIPTRLGGIPLAVKKIAIDVDRPGFLSNPTGCDPRELKGSFDADLGAHADATAITTAKNCGNLPFGPKLQLIVPGGSQNTHKGRVGIANHTPLRAIVTQSAGEASIRKAVVRLPEPLRPDTGVLNKPGVLCTTIQASVGTCAPQSQVGTASVITPLLPQPLSGPVYIVQDPGNVLPKLLVQLRGMAAIDLVAGNRIDGVRTVNTFDGLPDVPQSRFELSIDGGPGGILFNFNELCQTPSSADVTFTGHNGAVSTTHPELQVDGCGGGVGRFSLAGGKIKVSRKGVASVRVTCPSKAACEGKLSIQRSVRKKKKKKTQTLGSKSFKIAAGKTQVVKVKLNKTARRALKKRASLSVMLAGKADAFTVNQKAKLVKAKSKARKKR